MERPIFFAIDKNEKNPPKLWKSPKKSQNIGKNLENGYNPTIRDFTGLTYNDAPAVNSYHSFLKKFIYFY